MTYKTRRHIWSLALMSLAVVGVLAVVVALSVSGPKQVSAHDCATIDNAIAQAQCESLHRRDGEDHDQQPPTATLEPTQEATGGEPVSYVIEGPSFVLQDRNDTSRYSIDVLDEDGNPADFSLREGSEIVTVYLDVVDTAQGDIQSTEDCLPDDSDAQALDRLGNDLNNCKFTMDVSGDNPWFEIFATTIEHGTDIGISLEVDGSPIGDTHTVSYLDPVTPPDPTPDPVQPQMGMSDEATVVSYNDWDRGDHYNVTDGYIVSDAMAPGHTLDEMGTMVNGWLHRDEPEVSTYALGVSERESLTTRVNPQAGQRTVEVLMGAPNVQLTVTSSFEGPVYIRLLEHNGQVIGLDVDEEEDERGMDVVGLDSHGRLELPTSATLNAAEALAYDQYSWHIPGDVTEMAYLDGKAGDYHQGTFRVINPCADYNMDSGLAFSVQVWNQDGTYLKTTEQIICINAPGITPSALTVTTFSDNPGDARLGWREAIGATAHHVIVLNMTDPMRPVPVAGSYQRIAAPTTTADISGLSEDVPYRFAVVGERRDPSGLVTYSMPSYIDQTMDWE